MAAKLTRLTHKIATKLHLVAESCTIFSSRSRRPVRKLLDTPSYIFDQCRMLLEAISQPLLVAHSSVRGCCDANKVAAREICLSSPSRQGSKTNERRDILYMQINIFTSRILLTAANTNLCFG